MKNSTPIRRSKHGEGTTQSRQTPAAAAEPNNWKQQIEKSRLERWKRYDSQERKSIKSYQPWLMNRSDTYRPTNPVPKTNNRLPPPPDSDLATATVIGAENWRCDLSGGERTATVPARESRQEAPKIAASIPVPETLLRWRMSMGSSLLPQSSVASLRAPYSFEKWKTLYYSFGTVITSHQKKVNPLDRVYIGKSPTHEFTIFRDVSPTIIYIYIYN